MALAISGLVGCGPKFAPRGGSLDNPRILRWLKAADRASDGKCRLLSAQELGRLNPPQAPALRWLGYGRQNYEFRPGYECRGSSKTNNQWVMLNHTDRRTNDDGFFTAQQQIPGTNYSIYYGSGNGGCAIAMRPIFKVPSDVYNDAVSQIKKGSDASTWRSAGLPTQSVWHRGITQPRC